MNAMKTMTNKELAALWNVTQMGKKCIQVGDSNLEAKAEAELAARGIPHESGKLLETGFKLPKRSKC